MKLMCDIIKSFLTIMFQPVSKMSFTMMKKSKGGMAENWMDTGYECCVNWTSPYTCLL